jgi:hypothetical protein
MGEEAAASTPAVGGLAAVGATPPSNDGSRQKQKQRYRGNNNNNNNNRTFNKLVVKTPVFEGKCTDLSGFTYDCSDPTQAADMYTKRTKEIGEYVDRTYKYGANICQAIEGLAPPTIVEPTDPAAGSAWTQERIWEKSVDEYVRQKAQYVENVKTVYVLILGQCTKAMRAKLESMTSYMAISVASNGIELLKEIKGSMYNFQGQKYRPMALHKAKKRLYLLSQDKHHTPQVYLERFRNSVEVIKHCGGSIGMDPGLVDEVLKMAIPTALTRDTASAEQIRSAEQYTRERYLACALLMGSDPHRYGKLIKDLENNFTQGRDNYPKNLVDAYNLLVHWKQDPRNLMRVLGTSNDGAAFANVGDDKEESGNNRQPPDKSRITCWKCKKKGHYASSCPGANQNQESGTQLLAAAATAAASQEELGTQMLMAGMENGELDHQETAWQFLITAGVDEEEGKQVSFHQQQHGKIPASWILLDNQSTVNVFSNKNLIG